MLDHVKNLVKRMVVSRRTEMWLLLLVAYLFQRNVNSVRMPTKDVDPEAFMNIVSLGFPSCLRGNGVPYRFLFTSVYYLHYVLYLYRVVIFASRVIINYHIVL